MPIDIGTVVIVAAVLIFYLRLIIIQRERAKRLRQPVPPAAKGKSKKKAGKQPSAPAPDARAQFSILSPNRRDWVIAGVGAGAVILGILFNQGILPGAAAQEYWWLPVALGIVAFSWAFR